MLGRPLRMLLPLQLLIVRVIITRLIVFHPEPWYGNIMKCGMNHTTSTIQVPEQWKYPFYEETPSSLEILESVLHGPEHEQDYRDVDDYIHHKNESPRKRVRNPV